CSSDLLPEARSRQPFPRRRDHDARPASRSPAAPLGTHRPPQARPAKLRGLEKAHVHLQAFASSIPQYPRALRDAIDLLAQFPASAVPGDLLTPRREESTWAARGAPAHDVPPAAQDTRRPWRYRPDRQDRGSSNPHRRVRHQRFANTRWPEHLARTAKSELRDL